MPARHAASAPIRVNPRLGFHHARPWRPHPLPTNIPPANPAPLPQHLPPVRPTAAMVVLLALPHLAAAAPPPGDPRPDSLSARVDSLFAPLDRSDSPGCSLATVRGGRLLYAHGYGMANLELGIPNLPRTVFDIGSVSKQFTAMSVVLLAADGRLSLDDDVRRWVPELPDYGARITLRHLLHHTSGLRDYPDLFDMAGVPTENWTTDADAMRLIVGQKALNFRPGTRHLYSNTGYFLLGVIVQRASGLTLRQFTESRIFRPLGMKSTHVHDDHTMIVPRRATGYEPRRGNGGGFVIDMSNFEQAGDGSVMTTVEDLSRWDENFYTPSVGGVNAVREMQTRGVLSGGDSIAYALGLRLDRYRGLARVEHGGAWVGYRAALHRYPQQHFTVIVLCNLGTAEPWALAERVADIYLGSVMQPRAASGESRLANLVPPPIELARDTGLFWSDSAAALLHFTALAGGLGIVEDSAAPLRPLGGGRFTSDGSSPSTYAFRRGSGVSEVERVTEDGGRFVFRAVKRSTLEPSSLAAYAGRYESAELGTTWTIEARDGRLVRRQPLALDQPLIASFDDAFTSAQDPGSYVVRFHRGARGRITGFTVSTPRAQGVRFSRLPNRG